MHTFIKIGCISLLLSANSGLALAETALNPTKELTQEANQEAAQETVSQNAPISLAHAQDAARVVALIEQSQGLRAKLPNFIAEANQAVKAHHGALPANVGLTLSKALVNASQMRDNLFDQALRHRSALYRVDTQLSDADRTAEIIIGMAAAITLYDNHQTMSEAFENHALLRSKLNEAYPEFGVEGGFLNASNSRASNPEYRKTMNDAVQYFNDNKPAIAQALNQSVPAVQTLYQYVATSPFIKRIKGANVFKGIIVLPFKVAKGTADGVIGLSDLGLKRIKYTSSKAVGNTMGMVRWRDGKLKNDAAFLEAMQAQLQPGDILLEKSPFTLTDKTIPGHFGHAALYTGTAEQLQILGANSTLVQKNMVNIAAGHTVVEALRNGVQLNPLQHFMNIDDIAVLRPKYLNQQAKIDAVNLALGNLGKRYDFNFDVNTTETIVCSELIYIVYPQIDFVTKRVMGSFAITPDDVAMQAGFEENPLAVALFAHDGKLVLDPNHLDAKKNESGLALYNQLVKGDIQSAKLTTPPQKNTFEGFIKK